jgi:iron complex transport system permease protein
MAGITREKVIGNSGNLMVLLVLMLVLFAVDLSLGSVKIPLSEIINILLTGEGSDGGNPIHADIVRDFRLTKALTCILAGAALSIAGLQMQTLFRNALAGPDVLGLSSGASLAVALVLMAPNAGLLAQPHPLLLATAASIGCLAVLVIMLLVATRLEDHASLLIVGLMIGAATSSIVSVLQFLSRAEEMQVHIIWTFGSLSGLNWTEIQILTLILILGTALAFSRIKALNAWLLGDNYAMSMGVNVKRSRMVILLSAAILTGGVTAFCGPIAFVGIAVPHLTRLLVNTQNHKILVPAVLFGGAILLLFCDIVAQLPHESAVLPLNALTALIGAPVVVWVIVKNKRLRM